MDKERKGLFGRLLEFWTEKIRMGEEDRTGFWYKTDILEEHFAEMGTVVAQNQREIQNIFVQEMTEILPQAEKPVVLAEEKQKKMKTDVENIGERNGYTTIFSTERLLEERREETEENKIGSIFLWEIPEADGGKRSIVPVEKNVMQEEAFSFSEECVMQKEKDEISFSEERILQKGKGEFFFAKEMAGQTEDEGFTFAEEQTIQKREEEKTERRASKSVVDVEELMREMTRRLWEEREGCGRRLR